ncbi:MAG: acyltransferase family protein, partial [Bacteroidota bacterium]
MDGLRAVAVLIVLFAHAGAPFPKSGGVGVDIFFVISGFLITGILAREMHLTGQISFRRFYIRRALRLGPCLVLTCAFVAAIFWLSDEPVPTRQIGFAMTYTANWAMAVGGVDLGLLGHCWSLSIEEQYYLFWPVVILLLERRVSSPLVKSLLLVCCALLAALYRCSFVHKFGVERIYYGLDTHVDGLIIGSALFYMAEAARQRPANVQMQRILAFGLVPISAGGLMLTMIFLAWWNPWMGRLGFTFVAVAAAVLVADLTLNQRSLIKRPLACAPLVWTGRVSYGLYLYHYPVFKLVEKIVPTAWPGPAVPILEFGFTFVIAGISYHFIEVRFL